MVVNANNPYMAFKAAIRIALGSKGEKRPVFKERGIYSLTFQDDIEETEYVFGELNAKYLEELPVSDITVFTVEEFGKFFYEYGRCALANLIICITKADWNSVSQFTNGEVAYVSNYYNAMLTLEDHVEQVVEAFEDIAINKSAYGEFPLDFKHLTYVLKDFKQNSAQYKNSPEMCNAEIFKCAYLGLMFTLYGLLLLLPNLTNDGVDVFSFLKSPTSNSSLSLYKEILTAVETGDEVKQHFLSLVYSFYQMTKFLNNVSGFQEMDPMIGTMFDMCEAIMSKLDVEDDTAAEKVKELIDPELTDESFVNGMSLQTFTESYDPILDIIQFRNGAIITKDNCNIWDFGYEYISAYKYEIGDEGDYRTITEVINSPMETYLKNSLKNAYTNEDIERGFTAISNYINGVDSNQLDKINPGAILQLTLIAGAFRKIQKRSTQRSEKARAEINGAIDIADMLIYNLYDLWFKSGKFFNQPSRPLYGKDNSCNVTLKILKDECDRIIINYLEFVRFGVDVMSESDKLPFRNLKEREIFELCECEQFNEFIRILFPIVDSDVLIRLCANKEGRSIIQTIYEEGEYSFVNLVNRYARKELPKSFIKSFSIEPDKHTGCPITDRVIDNALEAKNSSTANPEMYIIAVFATLWVQINGMLKTKNVGNYFDFGAADASLASYHIEKAVAGVLGKPLKSKIGFSSL